MKINSIEPGVNNFLQITHHIAYAPKMLYYIGKLPEQRSPSVAIVGSRKPSAYGRSVTYWLAYDLAKSGVIIISGLALGVDGIAHQAALDAKGNTLAVVAGGLDRIYPQRHQNLARQMTEAGGAILSEYSAGTPSYPNQFLARNRLISALADMVIITEAAQRSGSLSTARHAIDQNKEVGAIPGNINSPLSTGSNSLIQQGAHLITNAEDVINIIAPQLFLKSDSKEANTTEAKILELIKQGTSDINALASATQLTISELLPIMTLLEIDGRLGRLDNGTWAVR